MSVKRIVRTATGRLRRALPLVLVKRLRGVVQGWGLLTARWRPVPDFIVVGAQRSGTTSLFRLLAAHPLVRRPTQVKGVGYFDLKYDRGMRWYQSHFPLRRRGSGLLAFESSGYYLFHPLAARRIAESLPDVKVVVVVRDPVERAYSAHGHERRRGFEDLDFEEALASEEERLAGAAEQLTRDPHSENYEHRHHGYLARSRYHEQIERYIAALGRERVFIVDAGRMFADPGSELEPLEEWLGLPESTMPPLERWNAGASASLDPRLQGRLRGYFEPFDRQLAELMGRTPSWRSDQPLSD